MSQHLDEEKGTAPRTRLRPNQVVRTLSAINMQITVLEEYREKFESGVYLNESLDKWLNHVARAANCVKTNAEDLLIEELRPNAEN